MLYKSALVLGLATGYKYTQQWVQLSTRPPAPAPPFLTPFLSSGLDSEIHDALATSLPQVPQWAFGPALSILAALGCLALCVDLFSSGRGNVMRF